jgi:hypothetical protein
MNTLLKLLFSLFIGLVAMGISKLVHPAWTLIQLSIFGLIIFVVTFIISLLI